MKHAFAPAAALVLAAAVHAQLPAHTNFESPPTRPLAVSADGLRLFAANIPDGRLSVYSLADPRRPILLQEIPVGIEPVAVRPRGADEVWVVNHVSDSISVVSLSRGAVIDTIYCKDEPADVVFAGTPLRAFVSVATDREVRVYDPNSRAHLATIPIFGDEPRALLASADGATVWVAVQRSGNETTIVDALSAPLPPAPTNPNLPPAPRQGIIVHSEDPQWRPVHGADLPDHDVVEIDAATMTLRRAFTGVGTNLQQLAERPGRGEVWVANTEALNLVRFEPNLRGHAVDNRVTRITVGAAPAVQPIDLNPSIDYSVLPNPAALAIALAQPTDLVFETAERLWVAAFGTDRVALLDGSGAVVARIEVGTATGSSVDPRRKKGPRALALHPSAGLLYVANTLANSITVIDTARRQVVGEIGALHDPIPPRLREGRGFLYDAKLSGNGTFACAGCHVDGTVDGVAWDLGDPGGDLFQTRDFLGRPLTLHPMKGPMLTQTLQGLRQLTPLHWRGDRPRFQDFNGAFDALMGGSTIGTTDIDDYAAFVDSIAFPPNPNLLLDRSLSTDPPGMSAQDGFNYYMNVQFRPLTRCVDCHSLTTGSNRTLIGAGDLQLPQAFKVAQLRNAYKKDGRIPDAMGRSTSGFGVLHDGSDESIFDLLSRTVFGTLSNDAANKTRLQRFVESFDNGIAPAVGYQQTLDAANVDAAAALAAVQLLEAQALRGNCELVAKGVLDDVPVGLIHDPLAGDYLPDRSGAARMTLAGLRAVIRAGRGVLTFSGVPRGSGVRLGHDRDGDGVLDGDARATVYGAASPGCAPPLQLAANSEAGLGNAQFALVASGALPFQPVAWVLGARAVDLPFADLRLLVDLATATMAAAAADGRGAALLPLAVPAGPAFLGQHLRVQALSPAACAAIGLKASAGLDVPVVP